MMMDKTVLLEVNNQCAEVQTRIAQTYDTPDDSGLIQELQKLYHLLTLLLNIKT